MVGSSLGGLYAPVFAEAYPDEVAGVVLVNCTHPDQWEPVGAPPYQVSASHADPRWPETVLGPAGASGLFAPLRRYPGHAGRAARRAATRGAHADGGRRRHARGHWEGAFGEVSGSCVTAREQARGVRNLGEKPLVVLTAPDNPGFGEIKEPWLKMQAELAALSSWGEHRVLKGANSVSRMTSLRIVYDVVAAVRAKSSRPWGPDGRGRR